MTTLSVSGLGAWFTIEKHLVSCDFTLLPCPNECTIEMRVKRQSMHESSHTQFQAQARWVAD